MDLLIIKNVNLLIITLTNKVCIPIISLIVVLADMSFDSNLLIDFGLGHQYFQKINSKFGQYKL